MVEREMISGRLPLAILPLSILVESVYIIGYQNPRELMVFCFLYFFLLQGSSLAPASLDGRGVILTVDTKTRLPYDEVSKTGLNLLRTRDIISMDASNWRT